MSKRQSDFFHTKQQMRILEIDRLLRHHGEITRQQICDKLSQKGYSASRHTFVRDIQHMREDLGAPLGNESRPCTTEPCGQRTVWFYRDKNWTLGSLQLTEDTLLSLFIVRESVAQYAGHPLADELSDIYDKLGESLNRKITLHEDVLAPVSFAPLQRHTIDSETWRAVLQATNRGKQLHLTYRKGWPPEESSDKARTIHPYHVVNLSGSWYLIGSESETDFSIRQFSMERIVKAKVLKTNCEMPQDFDIQERLDCTFGRFMGDPKQTVMVKVIFDQRVAPLVRERQRGPKEKTRTLPDGRIEVSFPASTAGPWPLYNVKSWVLSWGPDVEVVEPPDLRDLVRKDIEEMRAKS